MRTAEQVRYLILAAQREGNRQLMAALSRMDLTPAQSEALRIIADHGPLALKELGSMLVCDSGNNPSRIVDRLITAGLVQRDSSDFDRRQIRLTATPHGADAAALVRDVENQLYESIDSTLNPHDAQVLVRVLRALIKHSPAGAALDKRIDTENALLIDPKHSP